MGHAHHHASCNMSELRWLWPGRASAGSPNLQRRPCSGSPLGSRGRPLGRFASCRQGSAATGRSAPPSGASCWRRPRRGCRRRSPRTPLRTPCSETRRGKRRTARLCSQHSSSSRAIRLGFGRVSSGQTAALLLHGGSSSSHREQALQQVRTGLCLSLLPACQGVPWATGYRHQKAAGQHRATRSRAQTLLGMGPCRRRAVPRPHHQVCRQHQMPWSRRRSGTARCCRGGLTAWRPL